MGRGKSKVSAALSVGHVPTSKTRQQVERLVAFGLDEGEIAYVMGVPESAVKALYPDELARGAAAVNAKVGGALLKQALRGDVNAARFWLQSRARWVPATKVEHTGKDGGPIEIEERRRLIDEIVGLLDRNNGQRQEQPEAKGLGPDPGLH